MEGSSTACAFEERMLNKVRQSLLVLQLISRSGIDGQSKMGCLPICRGFVNDANTVWKRVVEKFHRARKDRD
jgi:hypothetical protein